MADQDPRPADAGAPASTAVAAGPAHHEGFGAPAKEALLALDLGCGLAKKAGTIGVDLEPGEGVDVVVDFERERLPFPDNSAGYVHSSNCLEHLWDYPLMLLHEVPRVCVDGARFEFWVPYVTHNHAHVFGHRTYWNEESFLHLSRKHRDYWREKTGVQWNLTTLVFVCEPGLYEAERAGFSASFAIRHLNNIVVEIGLLGHFDKPGTPGDPPPPLDVVLAHTRDPAERRPLAVDGWTWW